MPHIIVEYAEPLVNDQTIQDILLLIHVSVAGSGLFKSNQIKTRAYPFKFFTNADGGEPYIHIQARIKSGRDGDNKKQLSEVILSRLNTLDIPVSVITVEVIDMDRGSYGKYAPVKS